jgi:hypothetical protein
MQPRPARDRYCLSRGDVVLVNLLFFVLHPSMAGDEMLYWQPVGGLCVLASLRLCRFNERRRWALSRAEFIEGSGGKGKGGRACICIFFITVPPLGNAVATWCASPVG